MGVYGDLGVRTVINACGTLTRLGGTLMPAPVFEAMAEAARSFVRMEDLQEAAGREIARLTGAEAGYATNGAAGGLLLATAACLARLDVAAMDRLPDTSGLRCEVVMQRGHRNSYDHAIRAAGARIVEAGYLGYPGAGGTHPWQIEAAIGERTAAVAYVVLDTPGTVPLPEVVRIAHKHDLPVIVDAAAALPPAANLRRFTSEGADLVVFSGGKALRGPQASGVLAGRASLIESVALQNQDMDVHEETWTYRQRYLESGLLAGPPHQGIGRSCKVGKEEIVGLIAALRLYEQRDHAADEREWQRVAEILYRELADLPHVHAKLARPPARPIPQVHLYLDEKALGLTAFDLVNRLIEGETPVAVGQGLVRQGAIVLNPFCLEPGEECTVAQRIREIVRYRT